MCKTRYFASFALKVYKIIKTILLCLKPDSFTVLLLPKLCKVVYIKNKSVQFYLYSVIIQNNSYINNYNFVVLMFFDDRINYF